MVEAKVVIFKVLQLKINKPDSENNMFFFLVIQYNLKVIPTKKVLSKAIFSWQDNKLNYTFNTNPRLK